MDKRVKLVFILNKKVGGETMKKEEESHLQMSQRTACKSNGRRKGEALIGLWQHDKF